MAPLTRPRKRFAQHWLRSQIAIEQILTAAELCSDDRVLEIGPGTGILTHHLLSIVKAEVAVEIDRDLCRQLIKRWGNQPNFLLLEGDFLDLDLANYLQSFPIFQHPNKVVANIPYNITGPILEKLLGKISEPISNPYDLVVLLVQKEIANRLVAKPGTKAYGALTVRIQYLATCEAIAEVPRRAFQPKPKVDSAIIRLRPRQLTTTAANPKQLETLVKLGFSSRRKMLRNNLKSIIALEQLLALFAQLDINPMARAEDLSLDHWIALSNMIVESIATAHP